jgi:hypothetical protein
MGAEPSQHPPDWWNKLRMRRLASDQCANMGNNGWRVLVASCCVRQLGVAVVAAQKSSIWSVADPAAVGEPSAHERHVLLRLRPEHAAGWWNSRQFT